MNLNFVAFTVSSWYSHGFKNPSLSLSLLPGVEFLFYCFRWWRAWVVYCMEDGSVGPSSQQWACIQNDSAANHFGWSGTWGFKGRRSIQQFVHSTSTIPNRCKFWVNQTISTESIVLIRCLPYYDFIESWDVELQLCVTNHPIYQLGEGQPLGITSRWI
jgi:hypothetical protein